MTEDVMIIAMGCVTGIISLAIIVWGSRRRVPPSAPRDEELYRRLDRIEVAIESIAVEIERVSEAQRFTTRILADKTDDAAARVPMRVVTPH